MLQIRERDGVRVGKAVAFAELRGERLDAQDFGADVCHRLGMHGEPDVEFPEFYGRLLGGGWYGRE